MGVFLLTYLVDFHLRGRGLAHAIPIKSGEQTPPAKRLYRLTQAEKAEVEKHIADLLAKGWIQPSKISFTLWCTKPVCCKEGWHFEDGG